tara:strand:- start:18 stop:806 length:789 start_codon:yes stop_codon:yes gene_type:complete
MSSVYKDKEISLRKMIIERLKRGKIELSIWREKTNLSANYIINKDVIREYYNQLQEIKHEIGYKDISQNPERNIDEFMMQNIVHMPGVFEKGEEKADENEWEEILKGIDIAISNISQFRLDEGRKLEEDITFRINRLGTLLKDIGPLAKERINKIKKSLSEKIMDLDNKNIDQNRFEEEVIYYLEKQDITEEQVRLRAHLSYFSETMKADVSNGKKLIFIGQEIGREINTIGSKSSDAKMQRIVVEMKDELEKIKEQLFNIL